MGVVMTSGGGLGNPGGVTSGPTMEGTLFKWTNYWHGWQPRWFLLDQGVLTYYKSQEEVCQGCKGSVKISACEIVPHSLDSKRLDIIIPSEQHYYLKAASETERQQWLVLLGSVKQASALGSAFSTGTAQTNISATNTSAITANGHSGVATAGLQAVSQLLINSTAIKIKKSELRLCCDMLMQQTHAIKTSQDFRERCEAAETLNTTCDTFIRCLDSLMKLAECVESLNEEDNATSTATDTARELRPPLLEFSNAHGTVTGMVGSLEKQTRKTTAPAPSSTSASGRSDANVASPVVHRPVGHKLGTLKSSTITNGVETTTPDGSEPTAQDSRNTTGNSKCNATRFQLDSNGNTHTSVMTKVETKSNQLLTPAKDPNANNLSSEEEDIWNVQLADDPATFFSEMRHSFSDLRLIDKQIPIQEFLNCCRSLLPVFDVLGSRAFAPVKMDIQGNINKLEKHRKESGCSTLQELVQRELDSSTVWSKGSATEALLWLKRAMAFLCYFLKEACWRVGEVDLAECALQAYGKTLKKHHNFVVKGIFSMAVHALPYYSTFIKMMAPTSQAASHPRYERTLKRHGMEYTRQLQEIVTTIDMFCIRNDIISPLTL
ncbi:pleckstrin homology domain-containing family A member 8-like [Tropilaelaps mercedesae]|uniref:Pleckstrin homology domain-containing family A member 8 n=1 Tax=Tropilaelaps mercedesae TaxID=418985 RepID=A0A1V9X263_9ACAR|nr:pleckstrin homology domain-containing family A member 8-like [Tropilaelaps mercedesae]